MPPKTILLGVAALATASLASLLSGCGSASHGARADKAGGSTAPLVLKLGAAYGGNQPDASAVRYFAAQVAKLSGGRVRVDVVFDAAGINVTDVEMQTASDVRDGRFDLGWIGSRAWDEVGVTSFQALQAPFLITNYALLDRVVTSPIAGQMLAGLDSRDMVGLALVPGLLRHPVGLRRPLVSLSDFKGTRLRAIPSRATDDLLRSLGAVPVHVSNAGVVAAIAQGRIDGEELSFGSALPVGGIVTANVAFFGKTLTLFANRRAFDRLDDQQREQLRTAARRTVEHTTSYPMQAALGFEGSLTRAYCAVPGQRGHVALASRDDLTGLVRAARPVYAELEQDAETKALIARIRALASTLPPTPAPTVPRSCLLARPAPSLSGKPLSAAELNGTYRWRLTESGARAFGPPADDADNLAGYPTVNTVVLRNGSWAFPGDSPGSFRIAGDRIAFDSPEQGYTLTFTFTRDGGGTLRLTPVLPMDRGDQWVWSGAPWRRVGPPTSLR